MDARRTNQRMNFKSLTLGFSSVLFACTLYADSLTSSVQQKLKDDGFYYGAISGTKDSETVAAIRRYQIRNGLKVTGELDAETQRSLGMTTTNASKKPASVGADPTPRTSQASAQSPRITSTPGISSEPPTSAPPPAGARYPSSAPGPYELQSELTGFFDGTPYEVAPPEVQRRVIIDAQTILARSGLYRSGIDGLYGPGMQSALVTYQSRAGLSPNGLLDMDTLAALGLLTGQPMPGFEPPRRRFYRPRPIIAPLGERIYTPY